MARRGRRPKPLQIRVAEGNPGKRPLPNCPKPPAKAPPCPRTLSPEARRVWHKLGRQLADMKVLAEVDQAALEVICETVALWRSLVEKAREEGPVVTANGQRVPNPFLLLANKQAEILRKWITDFGMTPASRMSLRIAEDPEDDEVSAFMRLAR